MTKIKRGFTLLEILIVLFLLGFVATLVTIQGAKLISSYRFTQEVEMFFIRLKEAQILSITYGTDHALDFSFQKEKYTYQITTDEPFSPHLLSQEKYELSVVDHIHFQGKKIKSLHFDLFSTAYLEPTGVLIFSSGQKKRYIDLRYPPFVKLGQQPPPRLKEKKPKKIEEFSFRKMPQKVEPIH